MRFYPQFFSDSPGGQLSEIAPRTSYVSYELGNMDVWQEEIRTIVTTQPRLEDTPEDLEHLSIVKLLIQTQVTIFVTHNGWMLNTNHLLNQ